MDYAQTLKHYDAAVALCDGIERKGKSMPYTSDNGHMFSLINKDGELGVRFSTSEQERLIEELNSGHLHSHGAVMRGYVLMPDNVVSDHEELAKYLRMGHNYVLSLDPK